MRCLLVRRAWCVTRHPVGPPHHDPGNEPSLEQDKIHKKITTGFVWVKITSILKNYVTSEGAISPNILYYQQLAIACYQISLWKCRGRAVKSTEFKLWCFWSAECGFESPAVTLVSLSKTLNHCFVLRMGRKAVGPMCCVTHVKESSAPSALFEKGIARCSWLWLLYAP